VQESARNSAFRLAIDGTISLASGSSYKPLRFEFGEISNGAQEMLVDGVM